MYLRLIFNELSKAKLFRPQRLVLFTFGDCGKITDRRTNTTSDFVVYKKNLSIHSPVCTINSQQNDHRRCRISRGSSQDRRPAHRICRSEVSQQIIRAHHTIRQDIVSSSSSQLIRLRSINFSHILGISTRCGTNL